MRRFGAILKRLRLEQGLKQADLAKAIGLDHTQLSHIEKGTRTAPEFVPYVVRIVQELQLRPGSDDFNDLIRSAVVDRLDQHDPEIEKMLSDLLTTMRAENRNVNLLSKPKVLAVIHRVDQDSVFRRFLEIVSTRRILAIDVHFTDGTTDRLLVEGSGKTRKRLRKKS